MEIDLLSVAAEILSFCFSGNEGKFMNIVGIFLSLEKLGFEQRKRNHFLSSWESQ